MMAEGVVLLVEGWEVGGAGGVGGGVASFPLGPLLGGGAPAARVPGPFVFLPLLLLPPVTDDAS